MDFPISDSLGKPKILIVDDNPGNLQILIQILKNEYAVVATTQGNQILNLATKKPLPQLIMLDIMMPEITGYELCYQLKNNPETCDIPIIFVTALDEVNNETKGLALGAVDYIVKPLNASVVLARVKNHLILQKLNQELKEKNKELERITRLKDEFLANMSHEIRTPLNAILGMSESLKEGIFGKVNERQIKSLNVIEHSAAHLLDVINDVLDVAKIESGQMDVVLAPVSVSYLLNSSLVFVKQQAHRKNIHLELICPPFLPDLWGDDRRLRQVFVNLLNNAVKFTPEGGWVTLSASLLDGEMTPEGSPLLRIQVQDTGIGIAEEHLPCLFQPFVQINTALNRQHTGTGLGLVLVKQLVELHGGQINLISKVGMGSCFMVKLPCCQQKNQPSPDLERKTAGAIQGHLGGPNTVPKMPIILLVDDNEANIKTIASYLEAKNYQILLASNGQEAVNLTKNHGPDLIVMDIQMPIMDGIEAIQYLRRDPRFTRTPIIALTALTMVGDRERCLEAGATEYLGKPMQLKRLSQVISQHLQPLS